MRRGFTLIELCFVIAIMGLLVAIVVPTYEVLLRRAQAEEAPAMLQAIAHAELQHFRDQGRYLACPATGEIPRGPAPFPNGQQCWQDLGIQVGGEVRYRYGVTMDGGDFLVTAEGDLDRDGAPSRYTLRGRDRSVEIEDGLE